MTVTLADVAREVGVSTAAASLALNGKPGVSDSTRDRVLEAAERLAADAWG
ncbi:MAG: LacI family DNA-binding transcriptional regulator, partial [Actinobacteria bacterium]|nr:LacI family DNA-binding transcriptional regulator [Actinomycetota bacterium]